MIIALLHRIGVVNYPRRSKKKEPPSEHVSSLVYNCATSYTCDCPSLAQYAVAVVEDSDGQLLLRQRPQTGW